MGRSTLKSTGISVRLRSRIVNRGACTPSLTSRLATSRSSRTSSVRGSTTAARDVLVPAACRSTTVVRTPLATSDGGQGESGRARSDNEDIGVVHRYLLRSASQRLLASTMRPFSNNVNACWPTIVGMRRSSQQTKAVILAAARERFAESGFERATIRAIAADANIDPSMVMRYFGNKDQLFAAAADFDLQIPDLSDVEPRRSRRPNSRALRGAVGTRRGPGRAAEIEHDERRSGATHAGDLHNSAAAGDRQGEAR